MKSLFDRTKVMAILDAETKSAEGADGIFIRLREDTTPVDPAAVGFDSFDALCRAAAAQPTDIIAEIPAMDAEAQKLLANCIIRHDLWGRVLFVSSAHKTLDALKAAYPAARISPICDDNMVRPWIYAAYMGAPAYCADAKALLLEADAWGCPTVDRAHNANVCMFACGAEDEDTVRALVRVGCDAVLTHDAAMARALVW